MGLLIVCKFHPFSEPSKLDGSVFCFQKNKSIFAAEASDTRFRNEKLST